MANRLKGEVSLPHGGDTFTLLYDIDALCAAEEVLDLSVQQILDGLSNHKPRMGFVRGLLWAGLRTDHPGLSLVEVGQRFLGPGGIGMREALVYIADALAKAFPKPEKEAASGEADPPTPEGGTGSAS